MKWRTLSQLQSPCVSNHHAKTHASIQGIQGTKDCTYEHAILQGHCIVLHILTHQLASQGHIDLAKVIRRLLQEARKLLHRHLGPVQHHRCVKPAWCKEKDRKGNCGKLGSIPAPIFHSLK